MSTQYAVVTTHLTMDFEKVSFNYSVKNIPIPTPEQIMYRYIEKTKDLLKHMRWKYRFSLKENDFINNTDNVKETFNIRSKRCPQPMDELKEFENDLWFAVENIRFKKVTNEFQTKLLYDVNRIKKT